MNRYEHHFTVFATKDDAGIHWHFEHETLPGQDGRPVYDNETGEWLYIEGYPEGKDVDEEAFKDLRQRLFILT